MYEFELASLGLAHPTNREMNIGIVLPWLSLLYSIHYLRLGRGLIESAALAIVLGRPSLFSSLVKLSNSSRASWPILALWWKI